MSTKKIHDEIQRHNNAFISRHPFTEPKSSLGQQRSSSQRLGCSCKRCWDCNYQWHSSA